MTKPLFDVFREAMMNNPGGSRKELQDTFVAAVTADTAYLEILAIDYFERMAAHHLVRPTPLGHTFDRTDVSKEQSDRRVESLLADKRFRNASPEIQAQKAEEKKRQMRAEAAARTAIAFEEIKAKVRNVILLDLVMPDGKTLRHATGAECRKAGGFYAEVAKSIKPTQVVDRHLSEADLQNIRARFYQANREGKAA